MLKMKTRMCTYPTPNRYREVKAMARKKMGFEIFKEGRVVFWKMEG